MPQQELFPQDNPQPLKPNHDHLYDQLDKLGDMMGDGLHHEADGKWIEREYRKISKILFPETFNDIRQRKAKNIDEQMSKLLEAKTSPCCNVTLRQSRKGSKIAYCTKCNKRYKATSKK